MPDATPGPLVHDAEYYILFDQHGDKWKVEDGDLDAKLADLENRFGAKPNMVHVMWDDMAFGDAGIPALNKIRGFDTPNSNRMAAEGALFTRYYTEAACTPSRAAVITGRYAVRSGMYNVAFPIEAAGLAGEEVTMADRGELSDEPGLRRDVVHTVQPGAQPVESDGRGGQRGLWCCQGHARR